MQVADIHQSLASLGAKPVHIDRILRAWLAGRPLDAGSRRQAAENCLPRPVRDGLPLLAEQLAALVRLNSIHPGEDGQRLLLTLQDGEMVESVLLPRDGLCISTQVGCAVGCTFCMTGREGLRRQISSAEMLAQVVLGRLHHPVRRVVFMGMGEPAHNLDPVMETIQLLGTLGAVAHKNLVFSTVGDARVFERLPQGPVVPALAISLHSTDADRRAELLPRAPRIPPATLVAQAEAFARQTGYPIQYQWTLLAGINDSMAEMEGIVHLLSGKYAIMNFIPYNETGAREFRRPDEATITRLVKYLHSHGVRTTVRKSAGQDVDGGCGQLRARALTPRFLQQQARRRTGEERPS